MGRPRGRDWIPEGVGDGSNYDIGAEEFTPGPVTLWIPGGPMPVNGGEIVDVQWVLQPEAGQTIQLSLELDGATQADFGEFTSPTGQGLEMLQIPTMLVGSDNYLIRGTSALVPELVGETQNFTIHGPPPNAVDPRFWKRYGD